MASFAVLCHLLLPFATLTLLFHPGWTFPDQGKWAYRIKDEESWFKPIPKSLYKNSKVIIQVTCDPASDPHATANITVGWTLRCTYCYEQYIGPNILDPDSVRLYYDPQKLPIESGGCDAVYTYKDLTVPCSHSIHFPVQDALFQAQSIAGPQEGSSEVNDAKPSVVQESTKASTEVLSKDSNKGEKQAEKGVAKTPEQTQPKGRSRRKRAGETPKVDKTASENVPGVKTDTAVSTSQTAAKATTSKEHEDKDGKKTESTKISQGDDGGTTVIHADGVYLLIVSVKSKAKYEATVHIEMKGSYGYLSAKDWPLLPFYGLMCGIYVIYAVAWLVVSALQWRDLLRIQFWIGGVVFLGMIEMAVFYAEYQSVNSTGQSVSGAVVFAEIISCLKRTLARMLVIIVSLGFGIVKPRLGPMLHRVVGVGALYFVLGSVEGCLRALKPQYDPSSQALMASIPLAVLDSGICWWVFSSLVQTTRTLRLRRNLVKLSLYRHFTNTLIFAVLASLPFMLWSIHSHRLTTCLTDWKELWVDEAYWHLLFAVVLLVIMVLWRPTNNNQRFAFTPLLDAADDEDEEDAAMANDAFGMKMRSAKNQTSGSTKEVQNNKAQDDLKWVEEHIPSSLTDTALPSLLDSDEEIMTARFERNKME